MSDLDPRGFLADLEAKPDVLGHLADVLESSDPWERFPAEVATVVLVGMGSSHFACQVAASRMRARGVAAVAELAGSDLLPAATAGTVVVAVSAGGGSRETRDAVESYRGRCPVLLLTNRPGSALARDVDGVVPMHAGTERGGVACRSFQHTLTLLLALECRLTSTSPSRVPALVRASAEASADLLQRRDEWLPDLARLLLGPDGTYVVAPARRLSSAWQGALMLREGPRVPAYGCETGDWSHVDVYLTKTTDYRMLLFAGSRWEDELLRWTGERRSTVVAVGGDVPGAPASRRYRGDEDDDVRLLTETLVAELLAQRAWAGGAAPGRRRP